MQHYAFMFHGMLSYSPPTTLRRAITQLRLNLSRTTALCRKKRDDGAYETEHGPCGREHLIHSGMETSSVAQDTQ